jgi:hypothetical protein
MHVVSWASQFTVDPPEHNPAPLHVVLYEHGFESTHALPVGYVALQVASPSQT